VPRSPDHLLIICARVDGAGDSPVRAQPTPASFRGAWLALQHQRLIPAAVAGGLVVMATAMLGAGRASQGALRRACVRTCAVLARPLPATPSVSRSSPRRASPRLSMEDPIHSGSHTSCFYRVSHVSQSWKGRAPCSQHLAMPDPKCPQLLHSPREATVHRWTRALTCFVSPVTNHNTAAHILPSPIHFLVGRIELPNPHFPHVNHGSS
jgi:hypothetical protein